MKALLPERVRELSDAFVQQTGAKSQFDQKTGDFKDRFERIKFRTWLRLKVAPGDPSEQEFEDWLKGKGGAQKALKAVPKKNK